MASHPMTFETQDSEPVASLFGSFKYLLS